MRHGNHTVTECPPEYIKVIMPSSSGHRLLQYSIGTVGCFWSERSHRNLQESVLPPRSAILYQTLVTPLLKAVPLASSSPLPRWHSQGCTNMGNISQLSDPETGPILLVLHCTRRRGPHRIVWTRNRLMVSVSITLKLQTAESPARFFAFNVIM